jgi:hypothetical protein
MRGTWQAVLVVAAALGAAAPASGAAALRGRGVEVNERGRAAVKWTKIEVPGDEGARTAGLLKKLLDKAVKRADFGGARKLEASVRVTERSIDRAGDVARVSYTLVGRIEGGRSAKSRISFGGDPAKVAELEAQVLTMAANGLVTRLAELARERPAPRD